MKIGKSFKKIRIREGFATQSQLVRKSGVSPSCVFQLENGTRENLSLETLEKLAKAMGVKVSYLVGELVDHRGKSFPKESFDQATINEYLKLQKKDRERIGIIVRGFAGLK